MSGWDVDDRADWREFQDVARTEALAEARHEAQEDTFLEVAIICGNCDFAWRPDWRPSVDSVRQKLIETPTRCPRCGSGRKAGRR